jgi:hypothetical protein
VVENGGDHAGPAPALEGAMPGDHFVQHGAEGKDVGAAIDLFAFELFRRDVVECPDESAIACQAAGFARRVRLAAGRRPCRTQLRDTKIE